MSAPPAPGSDPARDPARDPAPERAAAEPNYEAARAELREIVGQLESGGQSLEESLRLWERGEQLADICQRWLDGASEQLDRAIAERDAD